jgi:hypothetical protein
MGSLEHQTSNEVVTDNWGYSIGTGLIGMAMAQDSGVLPLALGFAVGFASIFLGLIGLAWLAQRLGKRFGFASDDSYIAALFAMAGLVLAINFSPAGLSASLLAALAGVTGWLASRWLKNRHFFIKRELNYIDEVVAQSVLTPQQGAYYKQRIIERWLTYHTGVSFQEDTRQLPPKSEP